ncbi:hypothetical protein U9M48_016621 [Paspalum notatum var. saurae]|uniref:KIB1-4 beta-propeller domain-containing protein n=1 Tax=Paspalum notatum var. saurae TaxID=547442 RepID=A0AAQ3T7T9_PASNO
MSPASRGKRTDPERRDWIESSKKRRSSDAAAAVFEGPDSWACMNEDLLRVVAWRVLAGEFADYIRLRAVSRHWRSSTVCPRGRGVVDPRFHPRHWRMLPEGYRLYPGHTKLSGRARFFNLRTGSFASVCLPLFEDHLALDSVDGLLVVHRVHDTAVRLLHPFTGDIVELPLLSTLLPQLAPLVNPDELYVPEDTHDYLVELTREIVAAVSFSPNGAITAMLAFHCGYVSRVAFATSEDQQWTLSSWETGSIGSTIPFQGKLYFCDEQNQVFVVDPHLQEGEKELGSPPALSSLPPPKLIATFPSGIQDPYLVECDSEYRQPEPSV